MAVGGGCFLGWRKERRHSQSEEESEWCQHKDHGGVRVMWLGRQVMCPEMPVDGSHLYFLYTGTSEP